MQNKTKLGWGTIGPVSPSFLNNQVRLGTSLRYLAATPYPLNLQSPHLKPKPHENNSKFLAVSVLATHFSVL